MVTGSSSTRIQPLQLMTALPTSDTSFHDLAYTLTGVSLTLAEQAAQRADTRPYQPYITCQGA
jgi:hypothetical protein